MSISVTTGRVISTTTYAYGWEGTPGSSEAIERVNGVIARRNYAVRRATPTLAGDASSPTTTVTYRGEPWRVFSRSGAGTVGTFRFGLSGVVPVGTLLSASMLLGNDGSSPVTVTLDVGDENTQTVSIDPGASVYVTTFASPASTGLQFVDLELSGAANLRVLVNEIMIERDVERPGAFFNPATPGRTDTVYEAVKPILTSAYDVTQDSRNVVKDVLGRAYPDVILFPAGPRKGRLTWLFETVDQALECVRLHRNTDVLTFTDTELPGIGMTYVLNGTIGAAPDWQKPDRWTVSLDFLEVVA